MMLIEIVVRVVDEHGSELTFRIGTEDDIFDKEKGRKDILRSLGKALALSLSLCKVRAERKKNGDRLTIRYTVIPPQPASAREFLGMLPDFLGFILNEEAKIRMWEVELVYLSYIVIAGVTSRGRGKSRVISDFFFGGG